MKFELFILVYSFTKLLRMMTAATVLMVFVLAVCKLAGIRNWRLHLALFGLVPVACLMANSKIFFTGKLFLVTNWLHGQVNVPMAAFYFLVAGMLAIRYVHTQRELHKKLHRMRRLKKLEAEIRSDFGAGIPSKIRSGIRVYLSSECVSPFAGGIFRPFIVLPETFRYGLSGKQLWAVLYHEIVHIRQGHILLLHIYAWLKIIWWIHPLIYLLEAKLRESIEYGSDEGSVMRAKISPYEYAAVLLTVLRMETQTVFVKDGVTAFQDRRYNVIKKRMERLAMLACDHGTYCRYVRKGRLSAMATAVVLCMAAAAAVGTSMPRYTKMKEIAAYDERLHPLTYDMKKEGFQVKTAEDGISISEQEMQRFSKKYHLSGEYVIFSYDTIVKVPGFGGFGQAALVRIQDPSDVSLLARQEWTDRIQSFVMKYLI